MMNSLRTFLILLALLLATPRFISSAQPEALAITHAVIIDGHGKPPLEDGTLVIRAGKIEAVGPFAAIKVPANARVIDVKGRAVMPGLADMHVHLTGGWDGDSVDLLGFQRYLNGLLYAGVTTVLDTGNVQPYVLQLRQEVAAGRLAGPRIYCAGALIDGADPAWPPLSLAVSSVEQIPKIVRQQKKEGVGVIKAYSGLSDQMITALAREGKKNSLRVFIFDLRSDGGFRASAPVSANQ